EQGSFVTADYVCEDDPGGLGILDDGCVGQRPLGFPLDTSTLGTFTFWVTAVDKQLNVTQQTIHYSIVDTTPPTIALSTPADGTLSYNASNDRYTYLATTSKAWAGTCRDILVTFADGTLRKARFSFAK